MHAVKQLKPQPGFIYLVKAIAVTYLFFILPYADSGRGNQDGAKCLNEDT